jgi:bla regulator protein BlaR1
MRLMQLRLVGLPLIAATVFAQSQTNTSAKHVGIEVASIKPSDPSICGEYPIVDDHNGTYDLRCVKAKFLIQLAFSTRDFQISGGPSWLESTQYDITAKLEKSPKDSEVREKNVSEFTDDERRAKGELLRGMLQSLLAERFQLRTHHETKQLPVYLLTVSKGGSKLKSRVDSSNVSGGLRAGNGFLAGNQAGIQSFAQTLSQIVGRPILDRTNLTGKYDFELKWTPDQSSANSVVGGALTDLPARDPDRPNIFTALQEQLGLKLDSSKGPVEVVVVDYIQRPSAN